jgi:hypothetical protein
MICRWVCSSSVPCEGVRPVCCQLPNQLLLKDLLLFCLGLLVRRYCRLGLRFPRFEEAVYNQESGDDLYPLALR